MPDGLESRASGPYRNHLSHRPTKRSDFGSTKRSDFVDYLSLSSLIRFHLNILVHEMSLLLVAIGCCWLLFMISLPNLSLLFFAATNSSLLFFFN